MDKTQPRPEARRPEKPGLATSRPVLRFAIAAWILLIAFTALQSQAPRPIGQARELNDFDTFHIAGRMALSGRAADTYSAPRLFAEQQRATGTSRFMPWSYPPQFTAFAMMLGALPPWLAYGLFAGASLAAYLAVLGRIAGPHLPGVVTALAPVISITIHTGQNGFLTGALAGAFLLAFEKRQARGGLPLGLMAIKPHLAVGIALLAVIAKRTGAIALAMATAAASSLLATLLFGLRIWPAFFNAAHQATILLAGNYYPLYRMTSIYACLRSAGFSAGASMTIQGLGAAIALGSIVALWIKARDSRLVPATAAIGSLFVSPYCYDYDLPILGIAIAYAIVGLLARARTGELAALTLLAWLIPGWGIVAWYAHRFAHPGETGPETAATLGAHAWSFPALGLIALAVAASLILRRQPSALSPESDPVVAAAVPPERIADACP